MVDGAGDGLGEGVDGVFGVGAAGDGGDGGGDYGGPFWVGVAVCHISGGIFERGVEARFLVFDILLSFMW